jgi:pyrimidine-nucleoside phosphorylase
VVARDATPPALLIARKRDGGELTADELAGLIERFLAGEVEDAQVSAFLMAGVIRGFTTAEAVALTDALLRSGGTVDLSDLTGPTVDKHSTGGVGDTTTLVVAPLLAAAGCQVAKLSGRGLGHTGGTLDKLEAIPGFRTALGTAELRAQVERVGLAVAAATTDLVPADKRLYALRDVTGTVPSPALIASSVMSKKLAGGAATIVLDVKCGDGAFAATESEARALAELCVGIGEAHGRRTGALVTDMSEPLGDAIGNALDVAEAVEVLRGESGGRLRTVSLALAAAALELLGRPPDAAAAEVARLLADGSALERFRSLVIAQGGDPRVADAPREVLPRAGHVATWAPPEGVVTAVACRRLGELAGGLGAGRARQDDVIDPSVGIELLVRRGDAVGPDRPAARVHARTRAEAERALAALPDLVTVGPPDAAVPAPVPLVLARIGLGPEGAAR